MRRFISITAIALTLVFCLGCNSGQPTNPKENQAGQSPDILVTTTTVKSGEPTKSEVDSTSQPPDIPVITIPDNSDEPTIAEEGPDGQLPGIPNLSVTPMPDEEAEIAAMVLSRELVAPKALYNRISSELAAIRQQWQDSIPAVNIQFVSPFLLSCIDICVDYPYFFDTVSGGARAFDSLNLMYRLETARFVIDCWYTLRFRGRLNSARLVDIYKGLTGENSVGMSGPSGDSPMLLIYPDHNDFKYFFRSAWGDCPSGCMASEVYYFTVHDGIAEYHGNYLFGSPGTPPAWRDTFYMARDTAFYFNYWSTQP